MDIQTDIHTYRELEGRQTERLAERQTDGQKDRQTDRQAEGQILK
jgi:hypothetical protein